MTIWGVGAQKRACTKACAVASGEVGRHMNQPHGQEKRERIENKKRKGDIWGREEYEKTAKKREKEET